MKKSANSLFLISLVLIISLSLVSAFSFSDFWNKITGKTTEDETCVNADGSDAKTKGTCISYQYDNTINDYIHLTEEDSCAGGGGGDSLYEWGCMSTGACQRNTVSCADSFGSNYVCNNGACVVGTDQTAITTPTCTDTDIYGDSMIKGTATNSSGSYTDYCGSDGITLYEYLCRDDGRISLEIANCEGIGSNYICNAGKCILDPNKPVAPTSTTTNQTSSNTTKTTTTTSGGTTSSGSGGGGGGGSSSGASTTTPSITSPSATSGGSGSNVPSTISEKGEVVSPSKFDINPQESTITDSDGVIAVSSIQVSTAEGKAYATKGDGSKQEIKITPTTAVNSVKESTNSNSTEEVKIVEYENKVVYEINVEKPVKIIALVPAKMFIKTKVDVENGNIVNVKKPWWSFLAKED